MNNFFLITIFIFCFSFVPIANAEVVPSWIKNTAGWWADDAISETEFVNAIEYLVKLGIINITNFTCDENEDFNKDGIPDEIQNLNEWEREFPEFKNKNWSNCSFVGDLSRFSFVNMDLSNADFSNTILTNSYFSNTILSNADFSNSILHGSTFYKSNLINVNFNNADFSPETWESPFFYFTYTEMEKPTFSCYIAPCFVRTLSFSELNDPLYTATFGSEKLPTNLKYVDMINDASDSRTVWRHIADFTRSKIESSTFNNADLSHVRFFGLNNITNVDFSNTNTSEISITQSHLQNVLLNDEYFENNFLDFKLIPKKTSNFITEIQINQFPNSSDIDFDIKFSGALDAIPINWSMDMLIDNQKLYVADTDNHRIIVFDANTLEILFSFTSPIQNSCDGANAFSVKVENCPDNLRNLPSSLAIIDEKIFVSYGYQSMIQVFDMEGTFLYNFGEFGNQNGQLIEAHHISASENELFVADKGNNRIQVFDTDGNFLKQFSTNVSNIDKSSPRFLDIVENRIYVVESNSSSLLVFDTDGNFLKQIIIDNNQNDISISGIDVNDDMIFLTDSDNDKVMIFDVNGNKILEFGDSGNLYGQFKHTNYVVSNENKIFVSDGYNYRIQVFEIIR